MMNPSEINTSLQLKLRSQKLVEFLQNRTTKLKAAHEDQTPKTLEELLELIQKQEEDIKILFLETNDNILQTIETFHTHSNEMLKIVETNSQTIREVNSTLQNTHEMYTQQINRLLTDTHEMQIHVEQILTEQQKIIEAQNLILETSTGLTFGLIITTVIVGAGIFYIMYRNYKMPNELTSETLETSTLELQPNISISSTTPLNEKLNKEIAGFGLGTALSFLFFKFFKK